MKPINLYTIGFTKKTAEYFFEKLKKADIKCVVDVRLNHVSQLAGFAKQRDLVYFLKQLAGIEYVHVPELAPTKEMLDEYRKHRGDWATYEKKFLQLMEQRQVEDKIPKQVLRDGCLLCSEDQPHRCHRRLVAEYFKRRWNEPIQIKHLF